MGSPTKFFGTVRQKVLTENRDISPPPLILIFFRDQKFSEAQIRKVSLRNISALWDKIFDTKSWNNSLKPKIFRNPKLMTHWWVPLRSFSALWDNIFDTKSWNNSLKPKAFRYPKLMTHWWVPLRSFSALSDKKFWQKIVIFPPPSYPYLFFETRNFQKHRSERSLYETYRHCETKFSTQNRDITLEPKIFQYPKIMTHWWIPYEVFRQSDKKFWQKIVIFPPPSYPYLFSRPEIFRSTDQKGFSTNFFGTVRQNFRHKIVT